ncbi:tail fiber domain-containing protein [Flavobacteriaceae bacterium 14752]|uniref:tail fiber domain-containing protein n=1 Tax=Mesohalobacter salilacus TaxID=2491711 RepID=UPI000F62D889|nr:T9SS C-terminal target domain-containing protein [Flavobacteriaceae bacterium 14752]
MKKFYLLSVIFMLNALCVAQNQSDNPVQGFFNNPTGQQFTGISPQPTFPVAPEIFRFRPGLVTQLDAFVPPNGPGDTFFSFDDSRWFSIGRLQTSQNQTVYGLRFQLPNRALTYGYQDIDDNDPRIQWIDDQEEPGNLEFRFADSFSSTNSTLVAEMTNQGALVLPQLTNNFNIAGSFAQSRLKLINDTFTTSLIVNTTQQNNGVGILANTSFDSFGAGTSNSNIGVQAFADENVQNFAYAINGVATPNGSFNNTSFAGFFNGVVHITGGSSGPSDKNLKLDLNESEAVLDKLSQLKSYTYKFKDNKDLNLPKGLQHGLIAQELEKVYPELVKEIVYPIYNEKNELQNTKTYKSVNYIGLISELTAAIKELNAKVKNLEGQLETRVVYGSKFSSEELDKINKNAYQLQQNNPNPFSDSTIISYALPENQKQASILVFDLNGRMLKSYKLKDTLGELKINATDLNGAGMYLYTLFANGEEVITKRMILK